MNNQIDDFLIRNFKIKSNNSELYIEALTHRSYLNENKNKNLNSFERLEFLGDAILEYYASLLIFEKYPHFPEGDMTNLRSSVVKTETLAFLAQKISLGKMIRLSKGEEESGGRNNMSILADCFEALIAAIYLDNNLTILFSALNLYFPEVILEKSEKSQLKDYKSLLQETVQELYKSSPEYLLEKAEGPDHHKYFTVKVIINHQPYSVGGGYSKQKAEEQAAKSALEKINKK